MTVSKILIRGHDDVKDVRVLRRRSKRRGRDDVDVDRLVVEHEARSEMLTRRLS